MTMFMSPAPVVSSRFEDWPQAVKSIIGFWFFYLLTVVARAFLGHDPLTVLENKAPAIAVGVILTFAIYGAIKFFAGESSLRRQALVAALASFVASGALAGFLIAIDRYQDRPHDEFRFVSKEGYQVTDVGDQTRIERPNAPPVIISYPKATGLAAYEQFRNDYRTWLTSHDKLAQQVRASQTGQASQTSTGESAQAFSRAVASADAAGAIARSEYDKIWKGVYTTTGINQLLWLAFPLMGLVAAIGVWQRRSQLFA